MTKFRADLHCHSTCSDGTLTPAEIVKLACQSQLSGLSITDHDTIEAYKQALPVSEEHHLPLISGVEFSAEHQKTSVHILAYSFSLNSSIIQDFCFRHHQRRIQRNQAILDLLTKEGISLTEQEVQEHGSMSDHSSIGRPHIALAMVKKGYVHSIQQAFNDYIGEGKPCYAPGDVFSVEETIHLIHQAKGLAIIAHPHLIENVRIIRDLLQMNFDGIEGYYGRFPLNKHERWLKIGAKKGWIITGGSDFHGDIKPKLPLGSSWVNEEIFTLLYNHFKHNQLS